MRYPPPVPLLLETVPNLSEGRRPEVVARLAAAASSGPGVRLLALSSDPDHNRSVLTLAGEPEGLHQGLMALYEAALAEIDLTRHQGVHPRIGVVDVVPFVPLGDTPMEGAVAAANRLAPGVARRFGLPVYLYERAARVPERTVLANIRVSNRSGGFEGLAARLADPAWAPDFGPPDPDPTAGATVTGARCFLIAFNAVLATSDVSIARAIAGQVRERGGGLPAVRAMGGHLASRGLAQVSMNLVDYRRTPILTALRRVEEEAAAMGTGVIETEIGGLVREEAVRGVAAAAVEDGGEEHAVGAGEGLAVGLEEEAPSSGEAARLEERHQTMAGVALAQGVQGLLHRRGVVGEVVHHGDAARRAELVQAPPDTVETGEGGGHVRGGDAVPARRGPHGQGVRDVVPARQRQGDLDLARLLVADAEPARLGQGLDLPQRMEVVARIQPIEEDAAAGAAWQLPHLGGVAAGHQEAALGEQVAQPSAGAPER